MKQKIISFLFLVLFFGIFSYLFWHEYWEFQEKRKTEISYKESLSLSQDGFSLEDILPLSEETKIFFTPDRLFLDWLVEEIEKAQKKIWVEIYIFTEKRLRDAIIRAHKRGVEVQVLLENNPYMAPHLNDSHYKDFQSAGIDVRWSNTKNYALNHAKLLFIDDIVYVATWNFSFASFSANRDIFLRIVDDTIKNELERLFLYDFYHEPLGVIHPNIILSPDNSRDRLEFLISSATSSLEIYFPYIADSSLLENILQQAKKWIIIQAIFWIDAKNNTVWEIQSLRDAGVQVVFLKKPKLHAKSILVDKTTLYIGSINFSQYSIEKNREVGILLQDKNIIDSFLQVFKSDYEKSLP